MYYGYSDKYNLKTFKLISMAETNYKFQQRDIVRVIGNSNSHGFDTSELVRIVHVRNDDEGNYYECQNIDGFRFFLREDDIELSHRITLT